MLNQRQFIDRLLERYSSFFKDRDTEAVIIEYGIVLRPEWDFDKLYRLYISNWDKATVAPQPEYFKRFENQVRTSLIPPEMDYDKKQALIKVAKYFNSAEYQIYHKTLPPQHISMLIHKYGITNEMINQMIISDELYKEEQYA